MLQLNDQAALITGGNSGIGRAAALLLAEHGAKVAVLGRSAEELEQTAKTIIDRGGEAMGITADVAEPAQMQQALAAVAARWGRLNILFANAGINGVWAPLEDLTPEDWDKTLDVNLKGTFLTVKYAMPLLKQQGGSIIITASVNGTRVFTNTGATAYACSKAAQVAFTKMIALELAKHKIRVNVICPGAIDTAIEESTEERNLEGVGEPSEFPAGRIPLTDGEPGSAGQVARLVLFLASAAADHITGTEMWIDGGESLLQG